MTYPTCDLEPSFNESSGDSHGYRCFFDFYVKQSTPNGAIGVSIGVRSDGVLFTHPNLVFHIIIPESDQRTRQVNSESNFRQETENDSFTAQVAKAGPDRLQYCLSV